MEKVGICPKCWDIKTLTKHHIFPKRFFGYKNNIVFWLCRDCHDKLELNIPCEEKLDKKKYIDILKNFIKYY